MRTKRIAAGIVLAGSMFALAGCSASADVETPAAPISGGEDAAEVVLSAQGELTASFYGGYSADYIEFPTTEELSQSAVLSISGTISAVSAGREWGFDDDALPNETTVVLTVSNAEVYSGVLSDSSDGNVYVELPNPEHKSLGEFEAAFPIDSPVSFYLSEAATSASESSELRTPDQGRPAGQALYLAVSPQGFGIEPEEGTVIWPLEGEAATGHIDETVPGGDLILLEE